MTVLGRLKDGDLLLTGTLSERLPPVQNGLIANFPFDGTYFDGVGGYLPLETPEPYKNLIEAHDLDWRDPNNWTRNTGTGTIYWDDSEKALVMDGYYWGIFNGFIEIDPNKQWYIETEMKRVGTNGTMYLGDVSYQVNKSTTTPQHPGTHEYFGASGAAVPTTWTLYKNSAIGGVARTGTSTTTGDVAKFDPNCGFIKPLILAGYNTGVVGTDKLYIRNFKFYYIDSDISHTTMSYDGVYIEESTTNMLSTGTGSYSDCGFENSSLYTSDSNWKRQIVNDPGATNGKCLEITALVDMTTWSTAVNLSSEIPFTDNSTSFTLSMRYRVMSCSDNTAGTYAHNQLGIWSHWHTSSGNVPSDYVFWSGTLTHPVEWQTYVSTMTSPSASTTGKHFSLGTGSVKAGTRYRVDWIQFEKKPFRTSFVNGSRSAHGSLSFSTSLIGNEGSVVFKYVPDSNLTYGSYPAVFTANWFTSPITTDWIGIYRGNGWSSADTISFSIYDGSKVASIYSSSYGGINSRIGHELWIGIGWSLSTKTFSSWTYDATTKEIILNNSASNANFDGFNGINYVRLGTLTPGSDCQNAKYSNLSFYNRLINSDEFLKIAKGSFSITQAGNLITSNFVEKLNNISSTGTLRFPLEINGYDTSIGFLPSYEGNTTYENSSVWIGNSTTNMVLGQQYFNSSNVQSATYDSNTQQWTIVVASGSSTNWRGISYSRSDAVAVPGGTYTQSFEVYSDISIPIYVDINNFGVTTSTGSNDNDISANRIMRTGNTNPGKWTKFSVTYSFSSSLTQNFYMQNNMIIGNDYVPTSDLKFKIRNIQLEAAPFPSAYTNSTRGGTRLEYSNTLLSITAGAISTWTNFNEAARTWRGPVNNNDFKMLFSTYGASENNKLNIRSYYSDSANSWTAMVSSSTTSDSYSFTIPNGWHMITLAWDKTNSKWKVYVDANKITERTSTALPDSYVSNLRMGQWDTGVWGALNMYVRDLLILDHYPTDTEIANIYKVQMKSKNPSLQIRGELIERLPL